MTTPKELAERLRTLARALKDDGYPNRAELVTEAAKYLTSPPDGEMVERVAQVCDLTGWKGVARRLREGWMPPEDTNEYDLFALISSLSPTPNEGFAELVERCAKVGMQAAEAGILSFVRIGEGNRLGAASTIGAEVADAIMTLTPSTAQELGSDRAAGREGPDRAKEGA
jgi:hypothetical protein